MNTVALRPNTAPMMPVLTPQTFDQLMTFAKMAADSELVPRDYKGKPANIIIAVQMGSELGLQPMQALNSISVINGRPGLWGDGMIGICRQSPLCEDIREWFEGEGETRRAHCEVKRRGSSPVLSSFGVDDAKKAGLWTKAGPWTQYPDRMMQARARGFALRDAFPDLLRGLKTIEELRDYPRDAEVIPPPPRPASPPPATVQRQTMDAALAGDDIPNWDEPPAPKPAPKPKQTPATWTDGIIQKLVSMQTVEQYNDMMGDPAFGKAIAALEAQYPGLHERYDQERQTTLDRLADGHRSGPYADDGEFGQ